MVNQIERQIHIIKTFSYDNDIYHFQIQQPSLPKCRPLKL